MIENNIFLYIKSICNIILDKKTNYFKKPLFYWGREEEFMSEHPRFQNEKKKNLKIPNCDSGIKLTYKPKGKGEQPKTMTS